MVAIEKVHGRLQQAEASLNDVLDFSKQNELLYLPSIAVIHLQSAHLHFLRDKLDEALAEINTGLEYTKLLYEKDLLFEFYQLEAFIWQAKGNRELAEKLISEALFTANRSKSAICIYLAKIAELELLIHQKQYKKAFQWLKKSTKC